MCKSPFDLFGVECGPGWRSLVEPLFEEVEKYNKEHPEDTIAVLQVKEKYGSLRFYVSEAPEYLHQKIQEAEKASWHTCEDCGSTEDVVHTVGWIRTLCRECARKLLEDRPWTRISEDVPSEELP